MFFARSWKFDKCAIDNELVNTHTLTKDGVKHKFKPLKDKNKKVCSVSNVFFYRWDEVLRGYEA